MSYRIPQEIPRISFYFQGEILIKSHATNKNLLTPSEYFQSLTYCGFAYYQENEYDRAERILQQALAARRPLDRNGDVPAMVIFQENELKFKAAQCLSRMSATQEAISMLESIPIKQRAAKVNYLHGQLNISRASNNSAVCSLKEVLKEHQLALDVAETLLQMGVTGLEVNSLVVDATHWPHCEWLTKWIEAHYCLAKSQYKQAGAVFQQIRNDVPIQNHQRMMVQIGKCYYYDGSYDAAVTFLESANRLNPQMCGEGLVLLANLYCRENKLVEVEKLTAVPVNLDNYRPEHWFILALRLYFSDRYARIDYFLEKARGSVFLDVEVSLLKSNVYISLQKYDLALMELRGILKTGGHRFELYKNIVEVYTKQGKFKDAAFFASKAGQVLGKSPRTLMLFAKTYDRDPAMQAELKPLLKRIHKMDENYLPALNMLIDEFLKDREYTEALRLLRMQLVVSPTAKLAAKMGEICSKVKEHSEALAFYNMAVRLDPTCQKAINALNNMTMEGKRSAGGDSTDTSAMGGSSVMEKAASGSAGGDIPFDESGSLVQNESLWSDVDGEMNNN